MCIIIILVYIAHLTVNKNENDKYPTYKIEKNTKKNLNSLDLDFKTASSIISYMYMYVYNNYVYNDSASKYTESSVFFRILKLITDEKIKNTDD